MGVGWPVRAASASEMPPAAVGSGGASVGSPRQEAEGQGSAVPSLFSFDEGAHPAHKGRCDGV